MGSLGFNVLPTLGHFNVIFFDLSIGLVEIKIIYSSHFYLRIGWYLMKMHNALAVQVMRGV